MEKALIFLVFVSKGATANYSFLSFGPLAATYLESKYLILFLNQLTITTALIIALQFSFIRVFMGESKRKPLLWSLIGIHLVHRSIDCGCWIYSNGNIIRPYL